MRRDWILCLCCVLAGQTALAQEARWPQFRGPEGGGVAPDAKKLPIHMGPTKYHWKVDLPSGFSSPCIWGDRLFLTCFDEKTNTLETLCLDRQKGNILWRQTAPADKIEKVYKINNPATATPATDGTRVVVSFGS